MSSIDPEKRRILFEALRTGSRVGLTGESDEYIADDTYVYTLTRGDCEMLVTLLDQDAPVQVSPWMLRNYAHDFEDSLKPAEVFVRNFMLSIADKIEANGKAVFIETDYIAENLNYLQMKYTYLNGVYWDETGQSNQSEQEP